MSRCKVVTAVAGGGVGQSVDGGAAMFAVVGVLSYLLSAKRQKDVTDVCSTL